MKNAIKLSCLLAGIILSTQLSAQCISDTCGDIFADWAILNESIAVCEGVTFEVENQTIVPNIDFYVWDWGNGERDTVYEVSNYFYTYEVGEGAACAAGGDFIVYNISLEIYRTCEAGQSCHTQIAPVAVRLKPRAHFTIPPIFCAGDSIEIVNETCGNGDFLWIFPDGSTSTDTNPTEVFETTGDQEVTLIVYNDCGADTLTQTIEVIEKPAAEGGIIGQETIGDCGPLVVEFTNFSTNADYYEWQFPDNPNIEFLDNTSTTSMSPVVQFSQAGDYAVRLVAGNECTTSEWETLIHVASPPEVHLAPLPSQCDSATVALGDYLEVLGDYDELSWVISGPGVDMTITDELNPVVNFSSAGNYMISVAVQSEICPVSQDATVLQIHSPTALALSSPSTDPICTGTGEVQLQASVTGGVWIGPGVDINTGIFSPAEAGPGSHMAHYTVGNGACVLADSIPLEVIASETVVVTSALDLCESASAVQLDFSPIGGTWEGPGIVDANNGVFNPGQSGAGEFTLQYTFIDENNCVLQSATAAHIQASPEIGVPDDSAICIEENNINLGDALQPTISPEGGALSWSGDGILDETYGLFAHDGSEGTYTVELTYTVNNCVTSELVTLEVGGAQDVMVGDDQVLCLSETSLQLNAYPDGGLWTGEGLVDPVAGILDIQELGAGEHTFVYSFGEGTACASADSLLVSILDEEDLTIAPAADYCLDAGYQMLPEASLAGGIWSGPGMVDQMTGEVDISSLGSAGVYTFQYTYFPTPACLFTEEVTLEVLPAPEVTLELPATACVNTAVQLTAQSDETLEYQWLLDGSVTANGSTIEYLFGVEGEHNIELTAINAMGCAVQLNESLQMIDIPAATVELSTADGCGPLEVEFTAGAEANSDWTYQWTFGNGTTSTNTDPGIVTYEAGVFDTTYLVQVSVANACGEMTQQEEVIVRSAPVADFGTQVVNGCAPLEVQFANTTVGSAETYYWDLGNGEIYTGVVPPNQWYSTSDEEATSYTITLMAENACGEAEAEQEVLVEPNELTAFFNADVTEGCQPLTVNFSDYSSYGAEVAWNFGDDVTAAGDAVTHTFETPGVHMVYQYVSNACTTDTMSMAIEVLPELEADFEHPAIACPDEALIFANNSANYQTVHWDFGDGNTSTAINPSHHYATPGTYTVTMTIGNGANGCPAETISEVTIMPRPEVNVSADLINGCPPLAVCFTAEGEGNLFYDWDFGDGNADNSLNPCHTFTESGRHAVSLRAVDDNGCASEQDSLHILVFEEPEAAFALPEEVLCGYPQTVQLSNYSVGANSFEWSLNQGMASNLTTPSVTFPQPGEYEIELRVTNAFGCEDLMINQIEVMPQPLADFGAFYDNGCVPADVVFDNFSTEADSYFWLFGNGERSEEANPTHRFFEAGNYDVTLIVGHEGLCFDTLTLEQAVEMFAAPEAAFTWENPSEEYLGLVQFRNESTNAAEFLWDFGDGTTSEEVEPLHDFQVNGSWWTSLLVTAENGCTDETEIYIEPDLIYGIHFPNAFSPETGEGDVRVFKPAGLGIAEWELEIFSPWGERVFRSEDLNDDQPGIAWNGRYKGKILPQGAYAYKASVEFINGIRKTYVGSVTLLR